MPWIEDTPEEAARVQHARKQAMQKAPVIPDEPWWPELVQACMEARGLASTSVVGEALSSHIAQRSYQRYQRRHLALLCKRCLRTRRIVRINRARAVYFDHPAWHGLADDDICQCDAGPPRSTPN